jgi:hypothetical protein
MHGDRNSDECLLAPGKPIHPPVGSYQASHIPRAVWPAWSAHDAIFFFCFLVSVFWFLVSFFFLKN